MGRGRPPLHRRLDRDPLLKETAVDLVHAADRRPPDGRVVAVLGERADQEIGVVVALERAVGELARRREQLGDARHGKGAEERQLERARGVERELLAGVEVDDAHMVAHLIEATDLGEVRRLAHQTGVTRGRPAPVLDEVTTAAMRLILSGES
jgi:hypothetical protein